MTPNVLTYAQIFQQALDQQFIEISTTAWMEANASQVRYNGGNKVQIPKLSVEGLGTYSRSGGYPTGAATVSWEERTFTMDRGKEFDLDEMDYDETNFVAGASTLMAEFQRTKVVPEVDAYRYSQIFQLCNPQLRTGAYTPAVGTVYTQLKTDIKNIQDVIGENEPLVIAISHNAAAALDASTEIVKSINLTEVDFSNGSLATKTKALDGIPMFRIPSARFKTKFTFSATDGFSAHATAMAINWIIAARSAIVAVVKTDKPRIFDPDTNQDARAWKIQYRKYHDLWIKDNAFVAVYVSYTAIAAPALAITITKPTTLGKTKWANDVALGTGETLAYKMQGGAGTDLLNDIPTGTTAYTAGTEISATAAQHMLCYQLDATGHIVKYVDHTLVSGDIGTGA